MGSITGSTDVEDWLDLGNDNGSLPSLTLDDVLHDMDHLDDNLSFLDESDECSLICGNSPLPPTSLSYTLDAAVTTARMDSISHQLCSLSSKAGTAQTLAVLGTRLAVGTSKGMVITFNAEGLPEHFLPAEDGLGSASCLTFSPDGKNISVGFSKGTVKVISVRTGTVHHVIREAVQPGRGVLQIAYLDRRSSFLTLDSGGNVFEVRLKSNIVGKKNQQIRCVFSGCNGEVVRMRCLPNSILALLTVSKILLVSTRFGGAILCAFPLKANMECPPLLDFVEQHKSRPNDLRVCIARGDKLSIFVVHVNRLSTKQRAVSFVRSVQLPFKAVIMQWIKPFGIVVLDAAGQVAMVDTEKGTISRGSDGPGIDIVFGTADYKGLATGGNVSAALSLLAESVCYESNSRWAESVYLLTYNGVYVIRTRTEEQQLQLYDERNDVVSSCLYLLDIVRGNIRVNSSFRTRAPSFLKGALLRLAVYTTDGCTAGKVADLLAHYKKYVAILLYVAVHSKLLNIFYDEIWPRLDRDALSRSVVLESLDEWVLDGALSEAPPTIVSAYLCHLATEGHFSHMQAAVVRFPIQSIDLHHVMSTCRQNGLYDGIIYVMNKALGDYITPLEEMLDTVAGFASNDVLSDSQMEQGTRLLLYIHCCLAGQSYPFGTLPAGLREKVPIEVYRCITSLKGKHGSSSVDRYPYLRLLLLFDAQQFVHVICTCVDSPVFQEEGRLQRLTEMIGLLSTELRTSSVLVHFIRLVVQLVEQNHILPPLDMVEDAISCQLRIGGADLRAEETIVEAMRTMPKLNRNTILRMAHNPMRAKVCSFIYLNERRFVDLIRCYATTDRRTEIFAVIHDILLSNLTQEETKEVTAVVRSMIPDLCVIDSIQTAQLIVNFFLDYLPEMRKTKKEERVKQYDVLKEAFRIRRNRAECILSGDEELDDFLMGIVVEGIISSSTDTIQLENELQDLLSFWLPTGSRTDFCLNLAASAGCVGTMILLLEARGLCDRAFDELCEQLRIITDEDILLSWLDRVLSFCGRHSLEANKKGWLLTVFKTVIQHSAHGIIRNVDSRLQSLVVRILSSGSEHAHELFVSLLEFPAFRSGSHSDYSELISCILSSCSFEKTMLTELMHCMDMELGSSLELMSRESSHRVSPNVVSPLCVVCEKHLEKAAYVFGCGHIVHLECDDGRRVCPCETARRGNTMRATCIRAPRFDALQPSESSSKRDIFEKWSSPLNLCPH